MKLRLTVRDLEPPDLADLDWSGGAEHVRALAAALQAGYAGEMAVLVIALANQRLVAVGAVDFRPEPGAGVLRFDDVEIDLERRMVTRGGELVQLSRTEWLLLQHLAANAGKVVLHTELLTKVWGPEYRDDLQYLRVWVSRVRRKLGALPGEPGRIRTFQGIGYLLDVDPATHPDSGASDDVGVAQEPALIG